MKSGFISVHPLLVFFYFMSILLLSMWLKQPLYLVCLLILILAPLYYWDDFKSLRKQLKFYLFMALVVLVLNPLFYTEGATVLFYLPNRSVTLEGVMNGVTFSLSLLTILFMFLGYNLMITPQRFLYLFGNLVPKLSFILTIIMGFVPLFTRRMQEIIDVRRVQNTAFHPSSKQTWRRRLTEGMTTLNTLVSWSLEASLDNAISMRARGYGTHKRTSSIVFTFDKRDRWLIGVGSLLLIVILYGSYLGLGTSFPRTFRQWLYFVSVLLFAGLPLFIEMREHLRWHFTKFNI